MDFAPDIEKRLRRLVDVFLEENSKINLSAFRTSEQCWIGNVMDAVAVFDIPSPPNPLSQRARGRVLDLGTGGGFPLLPLAILAPDTHFIGIDSVAKKIAAVERIADHMNLKNVELVTGRAEELGHDPTYRETLDVVLSRAVAPINTLLEYCAPFAKKDGYVVLWKSLNIEQELEDSLLARAELSCHLEKTYEYDLGENWGRRQLLIFRKTASLSKKYPRAIGVPKKDPLQ